jgi:hypothetical protein
MPQSAHLALVPSNNEKFTVALPRRKPNAEYRSREHLTEREVERRRSSSAQMMFIGSAAQAATKPRRKGLAFG